MYIKHKIHYYCRLTIHILISKAVVEEVQFWFGCSLANSTDQYPAAVHDHGKLIFVSKSCHRNFLTYLG